MTKLSLRPVALVALGFAATTAALVSAPSQAADSKVHYRASLAQPVAAAREEIVRGVMWRCVGDACIGTKGRSRPVIDCRRFVAEFGAVTAFSAKDEALAADELAQCNAVLG